MRLFKLTLSLIFSFTLIGLSACGKKTNPRAPEALAPSSVKFLTARATVQSVDLRWEAPSTDASGDPLLDLSGFVVKRSLVLPDEDEDFETIAEVPLKEKSTTRAARSRDGSQGEAYSYSDQDVVAGKKYQYLVLGVNEDDVEGDASSSVRVTFIGESSVIESFSR